MKTKIFKKAVSPLIATILLIAFAVALGAVVMNWGRGYVEDTAEFAKERSDQEMKCTTDVGIDIVEIGGEDQVCYENLTGTSEYNITAVIENTRTTEIKGLRYRVIGDAKRQPYTTDDDTIEIAEGESELIAFVYNHSFGFVEQVKITPKIIVAGERFTCTAVGITFEEIDECE